MLRFLLALAPLVLLGFLLGQFNHALAPCHVYLFAGGLMVAFAALRLDFDVGLAAVFVAGLFCDANEPVRFGTQAFLFAVAYSAIVLVRRRLPREETLVAVAVALLANLGLFLALSVLLV
ncbi:MAG: hypothetical protein KGJ37_05705, partial [Verrucomicrobiota bacterium]|nr:hypothetical protein [Verrucomicrobiota bacterium]